MVKKYLFWVLKFFHFLVIPYDSKLSLLRLGILRSRVMVQPLRQHEVVEWPQNQMQMCFFYFTKANARMTNH